MTTHNHTLGFPRIGLKRELKKALEGYWAGQISQDELRDNGRELRRRHWQLQKEAGVELLPVAWLMSKGCLIGQTCKTRGITITLGAETVC